MPHYLIGIDEAGYGPSLGPLVVTATVFEVPSLNTNLWQGLSRVISHKPSNSDKITVCDSKTIYQPARGIKSLETSALSFALLLPGITINSLDIKQFIHGINHNGDPSRGSVATLENISQLPWYDKYGEMPIPLEAEKDKIVALNGALRNECLKKSVRLEKVCVRIVDADGFNSKIARPKEGYNKAELLFELTAELLSLLNKEYLRDGNSIAIFIGKQGGRTYYQKHLERVFAPHPVRTCSEKSACSVYKIKDTDSLHSLRDCTIKMLKDGEDKHFTIALSSIFCKYTRELCMKMFNNFWHEHLPDLKPTAGYYEDSQRFISEIATVSKKIGLTPESFIRLRS